MDLKSVLISVLQLLLSAVLTLLVYAVFALTYPAYACMGRSLDYGLIFGIPLGVLMSRTLVYGKIKGIGDFLYELLVAVAIGYFVMDLELIGTDWVQWMRYIAKVPIQIWTSIL